MEYPWAHLWLANFFSGSLEKKIYDDEIIDLPKLYLRYIDDVYAVFENESTCEKFLQVLNSKHENIRFIVEKSTDARTITFLDVQIELNENGYNTWVWRKPTNTGLLLNFNANCPQTWKSSLIMCLLHRAKNICSNDFLYKQEVKKTILVVSKKWLSQLIHKQGNRKVQWQFQTPKIRKRFFIHYWLTILRKNFQPICKTPSKLD